MYAHAVLQAEILRRATLWSCTHRDTETFESVKRSRFAVTVPPDGTLVS